MTKPCYFRCLLLPLMVAAGAEAAFEQSAYALPPIELDPMEVVSTATRGERLARDLPMRTEIMSSDLMRSSGAVDLAAALEYLPGLRSEANCQSCGTAEIKLLGLGAGYNQLLLDGQPAFSGLASVYGIEHIPTAFIDRVEVVKGGASALYGPGAVAGVINILPREPVEPGQRYDSSFEWVKGRPLYSVTGVRDWSDSDGSNAASLFGHYKSNEAVDLNHDGFSDITEKEFLTLGANGWVYPTETGKLSASYSYTWEQRRGGDRFDLAPHEAQVTEQLEHRWHRAGVVWEQGGSGLRNRSSANISRIERDSYYGGVGDVPLPGSPGHDPQEYAEALQTARLLYGYSDTTRLYLDSLFQANAGAHDFSWGVQYQVDDTFDEKRNAAGDSLLTDGTHAERPGQDPIIADTASNLGFFVQDEWMPSPALSLISGLRADNHSALDGWALSPRVALRVTANDAWTWRAGLSTGFRAPEIFDEDLHIEILENPTRTRNAPGLKEESSTSYSAGFVWTPTALADRFQAELELFRTDLRDSFHVADIPLLGDDGNYYKERVNAGSATVQGFESNLLFRISERLSAEAGLSFVDARYSEPQELIPGEFETRHLESPRWSGVAQLKYENEALADVFLGVIYTGPMIAVNEIDGYVNRDTDSFLVVDLTLSKHLHLEFGGTRLHFDLLLGVKNLLDERQSDLGQGVNRDPAYFYGPRFPRSYVAKAAIEW